MPKGMTAEAVDWEQGNNKFHQHTSSHVNTAPNTVANQLDYQCQLLKCFTPFKGIKHAWNFYSLKIYCPILNAANVYEAAK